VTPRAQAIAGLFLTCLGATGLALGYIPLATYAYPIVWWGLLALVDAVNYARWGQSPFRRDPRHFLAVTLPVSALFWSLYEYLNLAFPQWRYAGLLPSVAVQVAFGFASFATVIPIMVEFPWLLAGPSSGWNFGPAIYAHAQRWRSAYVAFGVLLLTLPLASPWFWPNQFTWIGPAVALLPWVLRPGNPGGTRPLPLAVSATLGALIGGFFWELINYWALTKWIYTIHPDWPRLFEMPYLGYLGFIPFAFSSIALYHVQLRWRPRAAIAALLWLLTIALLYILVATDVAQALSMPPHDSSGLIAFHPSNLSRQ
jgi:hypothetical protein